MGGGQYLVMLKYEKFLAIARVEAAPSLMRFTAIRGVEGEKRLADLPPQGQTRQMQEAACEFDAMMGSHSTVEASRVLAESSVAVSRRTLTALARRIDNFSGCRLRLAVPLPCCHTAGLYFKYAAAQRDREFIAHLGAEAWALREVLLTARRRAKIDISSGAKSIWRMVEERPK
jgi:hypothetical protein